MLIIKNWEHYWGHTQCHICSLATTWNTQWHWSLIAEGLDMQKIEALFLTVFNHTRNERLGVVQGKSVHLICVFINKPCYTHFLQPVSKHNDVVTNVYDSWYVLNSLTNYVLKYFTYTHILSHVRPSRVARWWYFYFLEPVMADGNSSILKTVFRWVWSEIECVAVCCEVALLLS